MAQEKPIHDKTTEKEVKVRLSDNIASGVYSNMMLVRSMPEEFVLDFMMATPEMHSVVARVIMSPGHLKRTVRALAENLEKYEKRFGKVKEVPEPPKPKEPMGFARPS